MKLDFITMHSMIRRQLSARAMSCNTSPSPISIRHYHSINATINDKATPPSPENTCDTCGEARKIQTLLKIYSYEPIQVMEKHLDQCSVTLSQDLIFNVFRRHSFEWKPAYAFFRWLCRSSVNSVDVVAYNEILDILGRTKQFEEFRQVFDEMSERENFMNDQTYDVVVRRYAAGHRVVEAIEVFDRIEEFGLKRELDAFQKLLLSLCRYKHVEEAELLFRKRKNEFRDDIKTWNIILNGWCLLRSLPDAKRFFKDILGSKVKPDKFTYGIMINTLCKNGKITTAVKLLRTMWKVGCNPDVAICNSVIDGLCFKKRIPEAFEIFHEMNDIGCQPNVATYNSFLKHLCKIQRMEKVSTMLREMEEIGGHCSPNVLTFTYLLKSARKPEEADEILQRMEKNRCGMIGDTYNLLLRLFMGWGDYQRVKSIWDEMHERSLGPDQRSYTIIVHGFCERGMISHALEYYDEMVAKGIVPETRTKILVDELSSKLNEVQGTRKAGLRINQDASLKLSCKKNRKR